MTTIMAKTKILLILILTLVVGWDSLAAATEKTGPFTLSLKEVPEGKLPAGWKIDATNPKGPLATWAVVTDQDAPNAGKVLSLTKVHDSSEGVFNLCWNPGLTFQDGVIEVTGRSNSGVNDQGGGIIWRARDANNYYIIRYNPLEENLRLYVVKNGHRQMIADAGKLAVKTGEWFTLKIVHQGDLIEGWLNGKKLVEKKDKSIPSSGGVGLWTKADAASSFKDLRVWAENRQ
jgi:hypothetical protein